MQILQNLSKKSPCNPDALYSVFPKSAQWLPKRKIPAKISNTLKISLNVSSFSSVNRSKRIASLYKISKHLSKSIFISLKMNFETRRRSLCCFFGKRINRNWKYRTISIFYGTFAPLKRSDDSDVFSTKHKKSACFPQ